MAQEQAYMFPTSVKEVEALGWDYIDIILFVYLKQIKKLMSPAASKHSLFFSLLWRVILI